jgi:hypothetical protein
VCVLSDSYLRIRTSLRGKVPENPVDFRRSWQWFEAARPEEVDLWAGTDGRSLVDRACRGERAAARELESRWASYHETCGFMRMTGEEYLSLLRLYFAEYHPSDLHQQRILRAIRRNGKKAPTIEDLDLLFASYQPRLSNGDLLELLILLETRPREDANAPPPFPVGIVGPRMPGRPRLVGLPSQRIAQARKTVAMLIQSHRVGRVAEISDQEQRTLLRSGILVGPKAHAATMVLVPSGIACLSSGKRLWLTLPWQDKLFWQAVERLPPGFRKFTASAKADSGPRKRCDAAATWFLKRVLAYAGTAWRRKGAPPEKERLKAQVHFQELIDAEEEITSLRKQKQPIPEELLDFFLRPIGFGAWSSLMRKTRDLGATGSYQRHKGE